MIEEILEKQCNGCGWCVVSCRMNLIHLDRRKKKAYFRNPEQCVVCFACCNTCPEDAIAVNAEKPDPFPRPVFVPRLQGDISTLARGRVLRREASDVAIVGAGVSGLTAAISAATMGARVAVFEKAPDIGWTNTSLSGGSISFAKEKEMYPDAPRLSAEEKVRPRPGSSSAIMPGPS